MESEFVIEMLHIRKEFPGIVANDDISLTLKKGEIHALLGENGAGKSTLMSVLFGLYKPEQGEVFKSGIRVHINNPNDANRLGIGMVHQHFKLVECFTVLDNIILGYEPHKYGFVQRRQARKRIVELSKKYGLFVDPDAKIEDITVGMQQRVEILKMLYRENEILIFDEPTAVLTPQEIVELMSIMRGLVAEGKSILFITHKLNEIMDVADRVTVLRKGKWVGTLDVSATTIPELSRMMVGRDVEFTVAKGVATPKEEVLLVEGLTVISPFSKKHVVNDVSFSVKRGEIVCIAGIEGNGQSELVQAITGLVPLDGGRILLHGVDLSRKTIRYRNDHGIAHIPEDRHKFGLILDYPLSYNLVLKKYHTKEFQNHGFIKFDRIATYSDELIAKFDVRTSQGHNTLARSMSGGNQQKAIIAREASTEGDLLVAMSLTRGLDVGAIEYIHKQIIKQRDEGKAVLLISLELEEVMNVSDRILVMYEGRIVGKFDPKKTNMEELGIYMAGGSKAQGIPHA
ncbi:MAG TPA: heme ABC transporter ATP-binding protein [Firmicutes bacterium]|nr:heme ABC transporter ATP-binding protein [Bacillota bacterium]